MERSLHTINTSHDTYVHDLKFDYYGQRLVTCSSDAHIKIFELNPSNGSWSPSYDWKAHSGSIWRVEWAHPEYGQVIASCSADRTVVIWEEPTPPNASPSIPQPINTPTKRSFSHLHTRDAPKKSWIEKAKIADSADSVCDIKFAPKHLGLQLATCSADGHIRIYEAANVMNLQSWNVQHDFDSQSKQNGATCLSWNQSPFDEPMLVVGCADGMVRVFFYNDSVRKWQLLNTLDGHKPNSPIHDVAWAPSLGRSYHLLASASKDMTCRVWRLQNPNTTHTNGPLPFTEGRATVSQSSPVQSSNTVLNTSGGANGGLTTNTSTMAGGSSGQTGSQSGLSTSLGGGGGSGSSTSLRDTLGTGASSTQTPSSNSEFHGTRFIVDCVSELTDHRAEVWNVQWNITGTILATGGDDGKVHMYKKNENSFKFEKFITQEPQNPLSSE